VDKRARRLAWAAIPLLALLAYAPVLTMWFVGDDFGHMNLHTELPWPGPFTQFQGGTMFWRPLSFTLTWYLGYSIFGMSALPYHAISLGLHALTAWLLGRAVATISAEDRTGWIAGAVFAVYPLATEPVAWIADQWDLWAAACALGAVWGFALSWRNGSRLPYMLGLLAAFAGVFMKESSLPLPVALPFVALAIEVSRRREDARATPLDAAGLRDFARRVVVRVLPYCIPTALFAGLRISTGGIGGYPGAAADYPNFFWTSLRTAALQLLLPLNHSIFSGPLVQVVGFFMALGVLVCLVLWGRQRWALMLLGGVWMLIFLLPVLNLSDGSPDMLGTRTLYFPLIGFCIALAGLLGAALVEQCARPFAAAAVLGGLLLAVPAAWTEQQPWLQSSRQTRQILEEAGQLLVGSPDVPSVVRTQGLPANYKGSYVFVNGFGEAVRNFDNVAIQTIEAASFNPIGLAGPFSGRFGRYNIVFTLDQANRLYHISDFAGTTLPVPPPAGGRLWDYTHCRPDDPLSWQPENARIVCAPAPKSPPPGAGTYAVFTPSTNDGHIVLPDEKLDLNGARGLRFGICARIPAGRQGLIGEWFWGGADAANWSQDRSRSFVLEDTGGWRDYWLYVPADQLGTKWTGLRFDPVNDRLPVDIAWVSLTPIR